MKRYKVEYFSGDRSNPRYLTELSKSGRRNGVQISFLSDGRKSWQVKFKNDLLNGIDKEYWWWDNPKNISFTNGKKGNRQGIDIQTKKTQ